MCACVILPHVVLYWRLYNFILLPAVYAHDCFPTPSVSTLLEIVLSDLL